MSRRVYPLGIPTFCVHEQDGAFKVYRPSSTQIIASYDREREVIAAARVTAAALHATQVRVVFIVDVEPS
jgi:hypothetical protein